MTHQTPSEERMAELVAQLKQDPGLVEELPGHEGAVVREALAGQDVYQIAQTHRLTEAAVWGILRNTARAATGQTIHPVESGGLGSDTDPGVTGGYGDTGFGEIDAEPKAGG